MTKSRMSFALFLLFIASATAGMITVIKSGGEVSKKLENQMLRRKAQIEFRKTAVQIGANEAIQKTTQMFQNSKRSSPDFTFQQFKTEFGKKYSKIKQLEIKNNFEKNKAKLAQTDCSPCGINSFFDRSLEDLSKYTGLNFKNNGIGIENNFKFVDNEVELNKLFGGFQGQKTSDTASRFLVQNKTFPDSFDWRQYNVVTSIKDQGDCGSCWAFTATAFLESELIRRNSATNQIDLSEDFLLRCDRSNFGCLGGLPNKAVNFGITNGMALQSTYPYLAASYSSFMCIVPQITVRYCNSGQIVGYKNDFTKINEQSIINNLLQRPVMIAVNADDWLYYSISKGSSLEQKIFYCSSKKSSGELTHAVLLVGYTPTAWLIKNSWGKNWGDEGYIWVTRDATKNCGIGHYLATLNSTLNRAI